MNDQHTVQHWIRSQEIAKTLKATIELRATDFILKGSRGQNLGYFEHLDHLYYFLLGYEYSRGVE